MLIQTIQIVPVSNINDIYGYDVNIDSREESEFVSQPSSVDSCLKIQLMFSLYDVKKVYRTVVSGRAIPLVHTHDGDILILDIDFADFFTTYHQFYESEEILRLAEKRYTLEDGMMLKMKKKKKNKGE